MSDRGTFSMWIAHEGSRFFIIIRNSFCVCIMCSCVSFTNVALGFDQAFEGEHASLWGERICWKFHKRTKLWKMSRSQRGTILLPPTVRSYINLARKWIPRNCVQKWARATKTFRPKKIQCNVNVAMVGTVKRHCQSLVVSIWYLMWDQEEEVSDCQIVKYKYLTSTNRWQPFDDHWGTSVASELNLWDNFQQPMGGRSLYSLMVGRNFDGPPI